MIAERPRELMFKTIARWRKLLVEKWGVCTWTQVFKNGFDMFQKSTFTLEKC